MSGNEQFAAHTRSASFALALSHPQIQRILRTAEVNRLREKYDWYQPAQVNFGRMQADELAAEWADSTTRALVRKGLVSVHPAPPPVCKYDVFRLTKAGLLLANLLLEAEFVVELGGFPLVPLHPDDRPRLILDGPDLLQWPPTEDRRDPADAPFLVRSLRRPVGVA